MTDLILKGSLNISGSIKLAASGGMVKVGDSKDEVMVVVGRDGSNQGTGTPVIVPPPPGTPIDEGKEVRVIQSFNSAITIKVNNRNLPVVALGVIIQGNKPKGPTWPGMVLPSAKNNTVTINQVRINVVGDSGITLPNGGSVNFTTSGQ